MPKPHGVVQFHGSGVHNGMPFTFFHDHFGDNFDDYICSVFCDQEERPEDPSVLRRRLRREARIDAKQEHLKPLGQSLKDVSTDGRVYLR